MLLWNLVLAVVLFCMYVYDTDKQAEYEILGLLVTASNGYKKIIWKVLDLRLVSLLRCSRDSTPYSSSVRLGVVSA